MHLLTHSSTEVHLWLIPDGTSVVMSAVSTSATLSMHTVNGAVNAGVSSSVVAHVHGHCSTVSTSAALVQHSRTTSAFCTSI